MLCAPRVCALEVALDPVQGGEAVALRGVAELVDEACEAVEREQVGAAAAGEQAARDGEVLAPRARHHLRGRGASRRGVGDEHQSDADRQRPSAITGKTSRYRW